MAPSICPNLEAFLLTTPPGEEAEVMTCLSTDQPQLLRIGGVPESYDLTLPRIKLYCRSEHCQGERFFSGRGLTAKVLGKGVTGLTLWYHCNDCREGLKTFALRAQPSKFPAATLMKYGEEPSFGSPLPSKLLTLLRESTELLSRGRRCENQGMGIGAFVYYRRVLDNQRLKILDQLIQVAERLRASPELMAELNAAKAESRFSSSIEKIKKGLPTALLINGHNPLTLLHDALSKGVHELTDEQCLAKATAIRSVLSALATRIDELLRDDAEVEKSVAKLLSENQEPKKQSD